MINNPELMRNLWIEITRHRLNLTTLILGISFYAVLNSDEAKYLPKFIFWVYIWGVVFWGGILAEMSMVKEIQKNTWPLQKMTSIRPWTMTWGKLIGGTAWVWFGALLLLTFMMVVYWMDPDSGTSKYNSILFQEGLGPALLIMMGMAILNHSVCLLLGFGPNQTAFKASARSWVGASIMFGLFLSLFSGILISKMSGVGEVVVPWYGNSVNMTIFILVSVWAFAGWALLGCYMQMRQEFQLSNSPLPLLAFMLFICFYRMGFVSPTPIGNVNSLGFVQNASSEWGLWWERLWAGWLVVVGFTYALLVWHPPNKLNFEKFLFRFKTGESGRGFNLIPRWIYGGLLVFLLLKVMIVMYGLQPEGSDLSRLSQDILGIVSSMTGFMVRDAGILTFFLFARFNQRSFGTGLAYLAVLYFIVPVILRILDLEFLLLVFLPPVEGFEMTSVISAWTQAGLIWFFVWKRRWVNANGPSLPPK